MEADIFYFVESCSSLSKELIDETKIEFIKYLMDKNICADSGKNFK